MRVNIDGVWHTAQRALVLHLTAKDKENIANMPREKSYYGWLDDAQFNNSIPEMQAYMDTVKETDNASGS